ncbi:unnamed protein product, partial [Nesidiocoris tenuis]
SFCQTAINERLANRIYCDQIPGLKMGEYLYRITIRRPEEEVTGGRGRRPALGGIGRRRSQVDGIRARCAAEPPTGGQRPETGTATTSQQEKVKSISTLFRP